MAEAVFKHAKVLAAIAHSEGEGCYQTIIIPEVMFPEGNPNTVCLPDKMVQVNYRLFRSKVGLPGPANPRSCRQLDRLPKE